MARDYAQRGGPERRQTSRRKAEGGLPAWVWLFAGVSIGGAMVAFHYIGKPLEQRPESLHAEQEPVAPAKPEKAGKTAGKKEDIVLPPKEKPRFTFYEILPSQEVVIPRDGGAAKGAAPPAAGEVYYIQVASYRDVAEAEKQKATLALLGVEARIEKVSIDDNKATYYRVRIGPDKSLAHAQSMMTRLADNGIDAMLVKLK